MIVPAETFDLFEKWERQILGRLRNIGVSDPEIVEELRNTKDYLLHGPESSVLQALVNYIKQDVQAWETGKYVKKTSQSTGKPVYLTINGIKKKSNVKVFRLAVIKSKLPKDVHWSRDWEPEKPLGPRRKYGTTYSADHSDE